jgi:uroporphyrinogen decarboxylase
MVKEYETPAGTLRQEVYRTDEKAGPWPVPQEARLFDDYNVPRFRRALVESEADLAPLRYLLQPPEGEALAAFREEARRVRAGCDRLGVLLAVWGPVGTDAAVWLGGLPNLIYLALDQPGVFAELLDLIHARDQRLVEILLDSPVELIVRRGWYDHGDFWSPALYEKYMAPRLQELTNMVHQGGRLMAYTMSTAMGPFLDTLARIGYDLHYHVDPVQGKADLRQVKATLGRRTALAGGMNSAVTLERGSDAEIRRAVQQAVEILAPGGRFLLEPVDGLFPTTPWHSVEVLIEAWREVRNVY